MKLIIGLGNPGEKYETTRHNLGYLVLDHFLKDAEPVEKTVWQDAPKFKSDIFELPWQPKIGDEEKVLLVKPKTYMNNSGQAVQTLSNYYKIPPEDIWIIHDELDLPLGTLKIRLGGAAAGHRGVENIIEALGTDKFWRFRLGIGHMQHRSTDEDGKEHALGRMRMRNVDDYVLGEFVGKDWTEAKKLIKHASDALESALEKGLETAQNRFNTK
jgi:peptidyl-tRNA hydrolase, PTH1 family